MGMAASQVRLLSLTSRLHDVELSAQSKLSEKIALATQEDAVYQAYNDALDATKFQVAFRNDDGSANYVEATFENLCAYSPTRFKQYALKDNNTGKMIVSEEAAKAYKQFSNDKYSFAWAMMGLGNNFNFTEGEGQGATTAFESGASIGIGTAQANPGGNDGINYVQEKDGTWSLYMSQCEQAVFDKYLEKYSEKYPSLKAKYDKIDEAETKAEKTEALKNFREELYKLYGEQIFEKMNVNKQTSSDDPNPGETLKDAEWDDDTAGEFNYYTKLWESINEAGGCKAVDKQFESGESGETWLKNMVESGQVTIQVYNTTGTKKGWSDTTVTTSINNNYLQEVQDDKDRAKAEAKYEHDMSIIKKKEKQIDQDLSTLETERKSITTEMDSIKQVRDDNTDRTFGIFS